MFSLLFGLLTDLTIPAATAQAEEEELTNLPEGVKAVKAGKETVEFVGCKDKKQTKVTIPAAIGKFRIG